MLRSLFNRKTSQKNDQTKDKLGAGNKAGEKNASTEVRGSCRDESDILETPLEISKVEENAAKNTEENLDASTGDQISSDDSCSEVKANYGNDVVQMQKYEELGSNLQNVNVQDENSNVCSGITLELDHKSVHEKRCLHVDDTKHQQSPPAEDITNSELRNANTNEKCQPNDGRNRAQNTGGGRNLNSVDEGRDNDASVSVEEDVSPKNSKHMLDDKRLQEQKNNDLGCQNDSPKIRFQETQMAAKDGCQSDEVTSELFASSTIFPTTTPLTNQSNVESVSDFSEAGNDYNESKTDESIVESVKSSESVKNFSTAVTEIEVGVPKQIDRINGASCVSVEESVVKNEMAKDGVCGNLENELSEKAKSTDATLQNQLFPGNRSISYPSTDKKTEQETDDCDKTESVVAPEYKSEDRNEICRSDEETINEMLDGSERANSTENDVENVPQEVYQKLGGENSGNFESEIHEDRCETNENSGGDSSVGKTLNAEIPLCHAKAAGSEMDDQKDTCTSATSGSEADDKKDTCSSVTFGSEADDQRNTTSGSEADDQKNTCTSATSGAEADDPKNTCTSATYGAEADDQKNTCTSATSGAEADDSKKTCTSAMYGAEADDQKNTCTSAMYGSEADDQKNTCTSATGAECNGEKTEAQTDVEENHREQLNSANGKQPDDMQVGNVDTHPNNTISPDSCPDPTVVVDPPTPLEDCFEPFPTECEDFLGGQRKLMAYDQHTTPSWKVGYLQVKLPVKSRGRGKLKVWRQRWVVIQMDEFVKDVKDPSLMINIYASECSNARRHSALFWCTVSASTTVIYRSQSRTHKYAFSVSVDNDVILHLAADSETASQEWIAAIRNLLWSPSPVLQLEKVLHGSDFEVSVIDNEFSFHAGLLGAYGNMKVTSNKLILSHPQTDHVIQEWYLNTLDKFQLLPQNKEEDAFNVVIMHTGQDSSTGSGQIILFCSDAVAMLQAIASTIHKLLQYRTTAGKNHSQKELADLADWLSPALSRPLTGEPAEDYYKVPRRQVRSLLDIPNFSFEKPIEGALQSHETATTKPSMLTSATSASTFSQDSGISMATQSDDFLNCSVTSFTIGGRPVRDHTSSESSDAYSPPCTPEMPRRKEEEGT